MRIDQMTEEQRYLLWERAAIKIFDAGWPEDLAMRQAEEELLTPEKRQESLFEVTR